MQALSMGNKGLYVEADVQAMLPHLCPCVVLQPQTLD